MLRFCRDFINTVFKSRGFFDLIKVDRPFRRSTLHSLGLEPHEESTNNNVRIGLSTFSTEMSNLLSKGNDAGRRFHRKDEVVEDVLRLNLRIENVWSEFDSMWKK